MDVNEKNLCLTIDIGDEYISKVEPLSKFEDSFFKEVYLKAFKSVEEILENNKKDKKNYENYNNIIAFTGERGTGKTSTMLSVFEVLKASSKKEDFFSENKIDLKEYNFFGLDVIDPSHFQEKSNIIEIILAKMFERFKKLVEDNENKDNKENGKKREVLENFEKVFKNIKIVSNGGGAEGEAIDALLSMSASSNLKGHLEKLIKSYLEFVNPTEDRKILVLEIDDLDLNTKYAYEMIEHIRKYLIIKNVVILMAVKIEQLSLVIERNTRKEFKELIKAGQIGDEKINLMSDKYLKKLISLERRLYMPDLEIESESKRIKILKKNKDGKLVDVKEEIIDKKVRSLIYYKTGMEFINGKYIVPNNLRDLVNIISFLEKMDDLDEDCTNKTMTNNFLLWKEYIFEIWIKKYLSIKQQQILKELYERDVEEKNKYIINKIEGLYDLLEKDDKFRERREYDIKKDSKKADESYSDSEKEYQEIINLNNNPKNICLGDVLFVLDKAKKYKVELQDQRFIYAIKMVYSIMLSEIYEASKKNLNKDGININKYQKLLGGYLYHPSIKKFMRESNLGIQEEDSKRISRDRISIYVKEINYFNKLLKEKNLNIFDFFENFRVKTDKIYIKDSFKRTVRQNEECIFRKNIIKDNDKIEFDILGFLFNVKAEDFYIRNIEILEKIFSRDYKVRNGGDYLDNLKYFFKIYKEDIDLNLKDKKSVKLYKKKCNIVKIEKFIEKIEKNSELKDEFNYLMFPKNKNEIKEREEAKEYFIQKFKETLCKKSTNTENFQEQFCSVTFGENLDNRKKEFLTDNKIFKIRFKNVLDIFNENIKKEEIQNLNQKVEILKQEFEKLEKKSKPDGKKASEKYVEIQKAQNKYVEKIINVFENSFDTKENK